MRQIPLIVPFLQMSKLRLKARSQEVGELGFKPKTVWLQRQFVSTISFAQKEIYFIGRKKTACLKSLKYWENFKY